MGFLQHWPLILILVIVLVIFGPGKLPQIGGAIGSAIKEFRKATNELRDEVARSGEQQEPPVPTGSAYPQPAPPAEPEPAATHPEPKRETSEAPKA